MLVDFPLYKKHRLKHDDEEEDEMTETQELREVLQSLHDRHSETQDRVDWNTIIAYISAGIGLISLIIAIVTIILMIIDRKRLKTCLERNTKSNFGNNLEALLH